MLWDYLYNSKSTISRPDLYKFAKMVNIRSLEGKGVEKRSMLKYEPYLNIMQYPQFNWALLTTIIDFDAK